MIELKICTFLNNSLKEIMSVLSAESGSLFLFDAEHKELVLDSFYNSQNLVNKGLRKKIGEGVSGKVLDTKAPVLVKDIDRDSRFRRNGYNHYHTKSFISIPLLHPTEGSVLGLINISDKSNGESFTEKEFEFAVKLCKYSCIIAGQLLHYSRLTEERKKIDEQNFLLNKYATVGKLAAGVVHQVNNPLDGIIRYANILLKATENNSVTKEYLLEIKKGLDRIANITRSLLEFSYHVNSNSAKIKKYAALQELINDSLDGFKDKIVSSNIRINKYYEESIPKILNLGLSHVFVNIIKNALDAMPLGGTLEISTGTTDSVVNISFKDTGLGIPNEIKCRLFEPFFTTKAIEKGAGLGLAICKEIINKYEGSIEVKSNKEKGATFNVLIPKKFLENA